MNHFLSRLCCIFLVLVTGIAAGYGDDQGKQAQQTMRELAAYWAEVSRSVREGDFEGYSKTCHPEGVLVSGIKKSSYPLSQALERWKQGFDDTRAKKMNASVEFRFSQRLHSPTTAHETGIFRYASTRDGKQTIECIHFEGLVQKTAAGWKIMMEYQKSTATDAEWKALAPHRGQKPER